MTAVPQKHLLNVLTLKCKEIASNRPTIRGYQKELLTHLAEIVSLERSNLAQPGHIQRQISDKVETLGRIIYEGHRSENQ